MQREVLILSIDLIIFMLLWYITFIAYLNKSKKLRSAERFIYLDSDRSESKQKEYEEFKKHF